MDDFRSGKTGTATINGTELAVTDWSVTPGVEIVRFRNSRTGTYDQKEGTFRDASGTISFDYDFDQSPWGAPLSLEEGDTVTNVRLYLNGTSGPYWEFPSAVITGTPQSLSTAGKITTSINFENSGVFTRPAQA